MTAPLCILAVEQSTPVGSLALVRDETIIEQRRWVDDRLRTQGLFSELANIWRSSRGQFEEVDLFAVGTGPGAFSGLRIAVAATTAMALPGNKPVIGISSGEALAWSVCRDTGERQIAVIGDARRGHFWIGVFFVTADRVDTIQPYRLAEPTEIGKLIPPGSLVVTSDWPRIGESILREAGAGVALIRESWYPGAMAIARLATDFVRRGGDTNRPVRPIYLHAPVLAPPPDRCSGPGHTAASPT